MLFSLIEVTCASDKSCEEILQLKPYPTAMIGPLQFDYPYPLAQLCLPATKYF